MHKKNIAPPSLPRAIALHQAGNLNDAEALYRSLLLSDPKNTTAMSLLGTIQLQRGNQEEGARLIGASLEINPDQSDALNNRGNALRNLKRYDEALASYDKAIALKPGDAEAHNNRGAVLHDMQWFDASLASYDTAIMLKPDYAKAYYNRGVTLQDMKRYDEALASYEKAIALKPGYAEAYNNRGVTLHNMTQHGKALASYEKAIALKPDYAEAYYNRGATLQDMQRYDEALTSYDKAIALNPDYAEAYNNRGVILQYINQYDKALANFEKAAALKPDIPCLMGALLNTQMYLCKWQGIDRILEKLTKKIEAGEPAAAPFTALAMPLSLLQQKKCAELYAERQFPPAAATLWNGEKYSHDRIRVGYFSADFRMHPAAFLMSGLFEHHDRSKFEVTAFSFGPSSDDPFRKRLEKAFEHFIDVQDKSDLEIASLARSLEIDIAIDRSGFTKNARTGIFALRPVPVQVNYLAYPGTLGANYIDYLIADPTIIPPEHKQYYDEKIVYMPNSYQANDSSRKISEAVFTRGKMGLPEEGFVFCCFNNGYKITPDVFDIWMRLLHKVPGSVLWLLGDYPIAEKNLRSEARVRGVADNRLVFAERVEVADHLARHRCADLFLDTFYYNAHTTASDALWAGLPVVTYLGESFAARVAASLLNAVGMPELITHSHAEYEVLALELATHPQKLSALRQKLARNRTVYPLFDTALFTRHIEDAYVKMWERSQAGLPPGDIHVQD